MGKTDMGLIPGLGRSPRGGHDNPLQYSCRENRMDRGAWWVMVHRVTESDTIEATAAVALLCLVNSYRDLNLDPAFWMILSIAPH